MFHAPAQEHLDGGSRPMNSQVREAEQLVDGSIVAPAAEQLELISPHCAVACN
jgi:hypothetical protein